MKNYYSACILTFLMSLSLTTYPLKSIISDFDKGHWCTQVLMILGGLYCVRQVGVWWTNGTYYNDGFTHIKQELLKQGVADKMKKSAISHNSIATLIKTDVAVIAGAALMPVALFQLYNNYLR